MHPQTNKKLLFGICSVVIAVLTCTVLLTSGWAKDSHHEDGPVITSTPSSLDLSVLASTTTQNDDDGPIITWTPSTLDLSVLAGTTTTQSVSFVSSANLNDVAIEVSPKLKPFITIAPTEFKKIKKGDVVNLVITVDTSATTSPQKISGIINFLKRSNQHDAAKCGDRDRNCDRDADSARLPYPLPIKLKITWATYSDPATGTSLSFPNFGVASQVTTTPTGDGLTLDVQFQSIPTEPFISGFRIVLLPNPNHLTLDDWFRQNIDPSWQLLPSGAFNSIRLPNGIRALAGSGPMPEDFGPVAELYTQSASGSTIIVAQRSQVNQFDDFGLTQFDVTGLLQQITATLILP